MKGVLNWKCSFLHAEENLFTLPGRRYVDACVWHVSSWMCFVKVAPKGSECCLALTASQSHSGHSQAEALQQRSKAHFNQ